MFCVFSPYSVPGKEVRIILFCIWLLPAWVGSPLTYTLHYSGSNAVAFLTLGPLNHRSPESFHMVLGVFMVTGIQG